MKRQSLLIILSLFCTTQLLSQKITMERIDLIGGVMEVYYTLEDSNPVHQYQVDLYSSKDNFAEPLTKVTGDIGSDVKPGKSRMISWAAHEEMGNYQGEIALEVRARVYIPFVKITGFSQGIKYKRGHTYPLLWESGNHGGQIDIELFKEQSRVGGDRNVPNNGKYEYVFPSVKPGKDYRLRFTNTRNRDEFTYTGSFRIIPKIPVVVKVGALAAILAGAAVTAILVTDGKSSNGGTTSQDPELPGHPGFPSSTP